MRGLFRLIALVAAVALMAVVTGCGPSKSEVESASSAVDAVSKLRSRVEAGLKFDDYSTALGDAKAEADLFLDSSAADSMPEVAEPLEKSLVAYMAASEIWNLKIQNAGTEEGELVSVSSLSYWSDALESFPGMAFQTNQAIPPDPAMQALWQQADAAVDEARVAMK